MEKKKDLFEKIYSLYFNMTKLGVLPILPYIQKW